VRRAAGLDFPETSPAQYYAVFEFETDATLEHEVRLVLGEHTTDVLWPLPGGSCRWSFELPGYHDQAMEELQARLARTKLAGTPSERLKDRMIGDEGSQLPELEESRLQELIRERAPWFTGKVRNLVWKNVIRFERRLAPSFGKGRLWLAGDAAHLAAPAGIQSMNLGLAEAHDLASALARSLRGGAVSDLQQYNNKWLRTWQMLQGQSARLHAGAQADAWLGSRSDALMGCLPAHGDAFIRLAAQLGFELAEAAHR
jgi:pentachlorophenol monooxygenase